MALKASEKSCCRSALDIVFKGRLSPPEFTERRFPILGNSFVTERSSGQGKRSHSRGICCSIDEESKIKDVEVSTRVEPVAGFCSEVVVGEQPETPAHSRPTTDHMAHCVSQSPATTPQRMMESSSWMTTPPAARQQKKHVIALSQLLAQASEQTGSLPPVRSIALDGLVTTDEVVRCGVPQTPLSTSGVTFANLSTDRGAAVDLTSVASVVDTGSCKGVTLIVRNIPRHILQEQILMQLRSDGFSFGTGHLDLALLYAPAVFGGHLGKPQGQGFGFVHANSSDAARSFMARWHRRHVFGTAREVRALDVSKAHVQGVQANLAQWSQTKTRRIRNSRFQPYVAEGILALDPSTDGMKAEFGQ